MNGSAKTPASKVHASMGEVTLSGHLVGNSQAAVMAAIEIYNKPLFQYRDECTVILLLNAWELLLKAILVKHGESIYYPQKSKQPARTLSWKDAFSRAQAHFPSTVAALPTARNLDLIASYRDKAVHFYNEKDMGLVVYSLSQTSIVNYGDVLYGLFDIDLASQINLRLLPLGTRPPIDAISFIQGGSQTDEVSVTSQYLLELSQAAEELKSASQDTGRLLTIFNVMLESVKKIGEAEVTVGVGRNGTEVNQTAIFRRQDPNESHPLRQKEVLEKIDSVHGHPFTSYVFQAIVWKYKIRKYSQYFWRAKEGVLVRYSNDIVPFITRLTASDVEGATNDYREHLRSLRD